MRGLSAFTLAEVLITLGIIGIVASMTLPTVINNSKKQETVARLKKAYSALSQAVMMAQLENDDVKYWDFTLSQEAFYKKYLKPYLQVSQEFINRPLPLDISYKCLNGNSCDHYGGYSISSTPKIILNDGTLMAIDSVRDGFVPILVDINGYQKPNQWGKDMFAFTIQADYGVTPYGLGKGAKDADGNMVGSFGDNLDRDAIINSNQRACKHGKDGVWCSALIMMDGWEIKKDYPW